MPIRLEARGERAAPLVFKQGAHAPYAIRWYGATSLFGHFRNLVATAIASESVDSRDWMRPLDAREMIANVAEVLGCVPKDTVLETLDRDLWIDWVADTGDDRDVSQSVGRMLFAEYAVDDGHGGTMTLPRGDVLLFGGDTAYPVATAEEIYKRVVQPWNEVLREIPPDERGPTRVLLGIPGNHDWYDGLDGFGRFFRRSRSPLRADAQDAPRRLRKRRAPGLVARGLHLDEVTGTLKMVAEAAKTTRAFLERSKVTRRRRLVLEGYEAVQESSYWALPLTRELDLWGVDRQLGRLDFRQREYFRDRRHCATDVTGVLFVAPDPARAFGDEWDPGERMLAGCKLSLERDHVLYLCGDVHHYERRAIGSSLHVIAGGGGAFLHGTRITRDPRPAARAYPDAATTRKLALQVPFRLAMGRAGYLVHIAMALVAMFVLGAGWRSYERLVWSTALAVIGFVVALYGIASSGSAHRARVFALSLPFGTVLGALPLVLALLLRHTVKLYERDPLILVVYAFLGALVFGLFLTVAAVTGMEMQQAFTVLGHPGFKHFVRLRVRRDGMVEAWAIGKDDPLAPAGPYLIDHWSWSARSRSDSRHHSRSGAGS